VETPSRNVYSKSSRRRPELDRSNARSKLPPTDADHKQPCRFGSNPRAVRLSSEKSEGVLEVSLEMSANDRVTAYSSACSSRNTMIGVCFLKQTSNETYRLTRYDLLPVNVVTRVSREKPFTDGNKIPTKSIHILPHS